MAKRARNIRQLTNFARRTKDVYLAAHIDTLIRITQDAHLKTIKNAKRNFTGRGGRKLTGNLMKSINVGFEGDFTRTKNISSLPIGVITVGTPYGAIHEFGGDIEPVKANDLWVKVEHKGRWRHLTPTEFFELKAKAKTRRKAQGRLMSKGLSVDGRGSKVRRKMKKEDFAIIPGKKGDVAVHIRKGKRKDKITPLFALKQFVKMPPRPYVGPAVGSALKFYRVKYARSLAGLLTTRFFK